MGTTSRIRNNAIPHLGDADSAGPIHFRAVSVSVLIAAESLAALSLCMWTLGGPPVTSEPANRGGIELAVSELLEMLGTPAILLDKRGLVVAANRLVHRSLGNELQIVNERLSSSDLSADAKINKLVRSIVKSERQSPPRTTSIRRASDLPIVMYGFRLPNSVLESCDLARAMLVLVDPRSKPLPSESQLKDAFDLSWMEAKLALRLAGGYALETAAAICGVTYESARSLVKSAYRKTGTHRQAELVALLYSIALVPRPVTGSADSAPCCELENRKMSSIGR